MTQLDDHMLLESLGAALRTDASPSPEELEDLRALVLTDIRRAAVVALPVPSHRGRYLRAAAIAAAIVVGSVAVGVVARTSMPNGLRAPARAIGLPVDSVEMADARSAMAKLRASLTTGDVSRTALAADELRVRLRALSPDEERQIRVEADALLREADAQLHPQPAEDPGNAPSAEPASSNVEAPTPVSVAEPADDTSGASSPPAVAGTGSSGSESEHEVESSSSTKRDD